MFDFRESVDPFLYYISYLAFFLILNLVYRKGNYIIEDKKINNEIKYHGKHDKQIYTIAADEAVNDTEIIQNPLIMFVL